MQAIVHAQAHEDGGTDRFNDSEPLGEVAQDRFQVVCLISLGYFYQVAVVYLNGFFVCSPGF